MKPINVGLLGIGTVGGGDDVVIARAADDLAGGEIAHHPGQHAAVLLAGERGLDVSMRLAWRRHAGEPQLPQPAVGRRRGERVVMRRRHGLEAHAVALERDGLGLDHAAPASNGGIRPPL